MTAVREVNRFAAAGLVRDTRRGQARMVRADTGNRLFRPLAEVMALTFGQPPVLREALEDVAGIGEAFVYGSWAARFRGQPGAMPDDIDILVIGSITRHDVYEALYDAERRLHREVNASVAARAADNSGFKGQPTVLSRPVVLGAGRKDAGRTSN